MRFATLVALLAVALVCLPACSSSGEVSRGTNAGGAAMTILDAPFGAGMAASTAFLATRPKDMTPAPGDGGFDYWEMRSASFSRQWDRIHDNIMYNLFSTNTRYAPYDTWGDSYLRDTTTILQTIDHHLFGFNWNDPYLN